MYRNLMKFNVIKKNTFSKTRFIIILQHHWLVQIKKLLLKLRIFKIFLSLLGRGTVYRTENSNRKYADADPASWTKRNSNLQYLCLSGRRQYMIYNRQPLWSYSSNIHPLKSRINTISLNVNGTGLNTHGLESDHSPPFNNGDMEEVRLHLLPQYDFMTFLYNKTN
jgi:hypothetical protein